MTTKDVMEYPERVNLENFDSYSPNNETRFTQEVNVDNFEVSSNNDNDEEDSEIESEKYHKKLHYLHSGIGIFLGQINMTETESKSKEQTTENIKTDWKLMGKSMEKKGKKIVDHKEKLANYKRQKNEVEFSDSTGTIVAKIVNASKKMFSWFFSSRIEQLINQEDNPAYYKQRRRLEKNRSARFRSHPYKKSLIMRSQIGPTILAPESPKSGLRPIVIDGSNIAMSHGRAMAAGKCVKFSIRGIEICVEFFKRRGHSTIVAFLPQHTKSFSPALLGRMEMEGNVVFTPSRTVGGRRIMSYDDRFIVEYAHHHGGVIVSRDNYTDLFNENPGWRKTIEEMLLMPTWVGDTLMFPADPLGRTGPSLDQLLRN